jgi:hypothetical protein
MITLAIRVLAVALLLAVPRAASAQTPPPAQPASAPAQQQLLNNAQLDSLLAPIALYPDALLSEVLMASTYPLEVVEADRWLDSNKSLKGDALKAAVDKQSWDDSVKSLTATPDVLDMMSNQLSWTQQLGDAVLAQQPDVMDSIQRLRTKAQANNKLASNQQQTVTTEQQGGQQVIAIAPTDPDTLYVPYYDPSVVYGAWPYPDYPAYPYYWPAPGYIAGGVIATGIAFGAGYALGRWVSNGNRWGGGFNWGNNNINVNRTVNNIGNNNNWTHNPAHRQGVRYNNANVAAKFGGNGAHISGGAQNRIDFRGRNGQQVLNPGAGGGANRPNVGGGNLTPGTRAGGGGGTANRPGAGGGTAANRPGGNVRPGANTRPGGSATNTRPTKAAPRPSGGGAMGNIGSGHAANIQSARGAQSLGGGGPRGGGGGAAHMGGGGGGPRGGGGGGARGGGGRRSDIRLKHDIVLLGHLDNGLGVYRFVYNGETRPYVGVMAQDVENVRPDAVIRGADGYLRVDYDRLGLKFETYDAWLASGGRMPVVAH